MYVLLSGPRFLELSTHTCSIECIPFLVFKEWLPVIRTSNKHLTPIIYLKAQLSLKKDHARLVSLLRMNSYG